MLSAPVKNELPENNSNIKPNNRSPGKINVSRSWPTKVRIFRVCP